MAATTPALSLDDWYSQYAPLSDAQRVSVSRVSAWVSTQADRADAALQESDSAPPPRATSLTHRLASIAAQQAQALHPDDTHEMDLLQDGVRELDSLTAQVAELQASMAQLRAGLAFVQDSSSDLMGQASHYLHDQLRLGYFSVLPPATALLSSTGTNVDTPEFRSTVDRLLLALKFMESHRQYLDAPVYQLRLLNALQRAMSIVRQSFSVAGAELVKESQMHIREALHVRDYAAENRFFDPSSSRVDELLYGRFQPLHAKYATYMENLAQLAAQHEEVRSVWQDIQALWSQWRVSLLKDCLAACTSSAGESNMTLCARLEQLLTCMERYSEHERALCVQMFPSTTADTVLDKVFAAIHSHIHAWLAPQWASVGLEAMAELAAAIQRYRNEPWCAPIYLEALERLERCATTVYKNKLGAFVPTREDLAYPAILQDWQRTSSTSAPGTSEMAQSTWYAPVRMVHTLLEALGPHLSPTALASWTYKVVHECQQKVQEASKTMRVDKVGSDEGDAGDALLFQLQHLLILHAHVQKVQSMVGDVDALAPASKSTTSALWFLGNWGTSPSRPATLHTLTEDLEAAITATTNEVGAFLSANLALPLQIFAQQASATPSKAWDAWKAFQQSLDVNVDDMRVKWPLYLDATQVEATRKAMLQALRATYEAFLARWQALVTGNSSDEACAQLSHVPPPEQLCTQLCQKLLA